MVSMEWFEEQDDEYKEEILPKHPRPASPSAGSAMSWYKYLGSYGKAIAIDQFGLQGDGAQNMIDLGITAEHVVEAAKAPSKRLADSSMRGCHPASPPLAYTGRRWIFSTTQIRRYIMTASTQAISDAGVSIWLDDPVPAPALSRKSRRAHQER